VYDKPQSQKFLKKLSQPSETKIQILQDLIKLLEGQCSEQISCDEINRICSMYLYENQSKGWKNEDVFFLLRYAISGNPVGAPTGDIGEVIGLK
jgi:hypothetical protein